MPRILIASDDHDLSYARLRELLGDEDLSEMSDTLTSDSAKPELLEAAIQVSVTALDQVATGIQSRAHLGIYLDAVVLLTLRPYQDRKTLLRKAVSQMRDLDDTLCFPNGIRVKVLPVILIDLVSLLTGAAPDTEDYQGLAQFRWCYVQPAGNTFGEEVSTAIGAWRADLLLELDYIGYAISFDELGQIEVDHVLRRKRRESVFFDNTASPDNLRRSGYLRLPQDLLSDFAPYRKLQYVLNRMRDLPPKEQEPALQACLDENPSLIYRDVFDKHWSQPTLRHPDPFQSDIVPDFILQGAGAQEYPEWEVLEIKTSEQPAVSRGKFTEFFLKAMRQLRLYYANYFESRQTAAEQVKKLGRVIQKPRMALLIGRKPSDEDAEVLSDARRQSEWNDVLIISYDDLYNAGVQKLTLSKKMMEGQKLL